MSQIKKLDALFVLVLAVLTLTSCAGEPRAYKLDLSLEAQLRAIDAVLDSLPKGNIAYNVPPSMEIDKPERVHLLLSPSVSVKELEERIRLRTSTDKGLEGTVIHISPQMEAHLSGENFSILAVKPEKQAVAAMATTEWQWQVTPKRGGEQELHLTLNVILDVDKQNVQRALTTFDKTIHVKVSMPRLIGDFLRDNWGWIAGVGGAIIAAVGWLFRKKKKTDTGDTRTP